MRSFVVSASWRRRFDVSRGTACRARRKNLAGLSYSLRCKNSEATAKHFVARGAWLARMCLWLVRARPRELMRDLRHAVPLLPETAKAKRTMWLHCAKQRDRAAAIRLAQAAFSRPPAGGACATELQLPAATCLVLRRAS
jgi:hypothetical protein